MKSEQGNIASKWQSHDLNPDILVYFFLFSLAQFHLSFSSLWVTISVIIGGGFPSRGCAKVLGLCKAPYGRAMQQGMPFGNLQRLIIDH